ncbi:signal peptidase II [Anaerosporobacter sp.]
MKYLKEYINKIMILIAFDQGVKLIISKWLIDEECDILGNIIRFNPSQNTNLTWGGNFVAILSNMWVVLSINILIIALFISGYSFYRSKKNKPSVPVDTIYIYGMAGSLCSFIDKVFWGGSLDFIQISSFFICDIKDCYITIAECFFFVIGFKHEKEISAKEYLKFCFKK